MQNCEIKTDFQNFEGFSAFLLPSNFFAEIEAKFKALEDRFAKFSRKDRIIEIEEVAKKIKRKKSTVYALSHKGLIPVLSKKGEKLLFSELEIEEWLENKKQTLTK
jgi:excisionase family DNA binding protein